MSQTVSRSTSPNVIDTDATAKGYDRLGNNDTTSPEPKPLSESSTNNISELPRDRDADIAPPAAISAAPAPASLAFIPPHLVSETPNASSSRRPRSHPASRDTSPYPRSRPSTPNRPSTPGGSSAASAVRPAAPRRSARTLAKGPERPSGPPELEAALTIAIRNLESDIYEWWCANQKPGSPIPTTAYLKGRSPRIRRAAEAVDEADRLLNEAIYVKTKRGPGRPPTRKLQSKNVPETLPGELPETAFGQLELNSQANSPLRRYEGTENKASDEEYGQKRRSTPGKGTTGE